MKLYLLLLLLLSTIIGLSQPVNDSHSNAILLTETSQWASADAAYSNVGATFDGTQSCSVYGTGNVWFKFQATTSEIDIRLMTGGTKGTLTVPIITLFNETLSSTLGCYSNGVPVAYVQSVALTVGSWYYLSVDSRTSVGGTLGTFSLEIKNQLDYDLRAKAEMVPHASGWESADAVYTNVGATFDGNSGSCGWGGGNVWFKFQAVTNEIDIRLKTGGTKGTLTVPIVTLFNDNLSQALGCYTNGVPVAYVQSIALIPGNWYYISVDSRTSVGGTLGSFSLEIKNQVNYDLKAKAELIPHSSLWTSTDAAYSNVNSTGDGNSACGYGSGNVWFKFQATTNEVDIRLMIGGVKGTLSGTIITLFNEDLSQALACSPNGIPIAYIQSTALIPGNWYYLSVDSHFGGAQGTFTLQIKNTLGYDLQNKAEEIVHSVQWCTQQNQYTNYAANSDGQNGGNCTSYSANVWFKFKATSSQASIKVTPGALTYPYIHLVDATNNILKCGGANSGLPVSIDYPSLEKGKWYFISVGTAPDVGGHTGTFTLCLEGGTEIPEEVSNQVCGNLYCTEGGVGVGISTIPQGYALAVKGKIMSEGVKVEVQSKWPDYVFEEEYKQIGLPELKKYIQQNGHLPDVPKSAEVVKEGIDLGEMNVLLLKKIEELTLSLIEMEERVKELERNNQKIGKQEINK